MLEVSSIVEDGKAWLNVATVGKQIIKKKDSRYWSELRIENENIERIFKYIQE